MIVNLCAVGILALVAVCVFGIFIHGVNINVNVMNKYEQGEYVKLDDEYDEEGNPKSDSERVTIDDILTTVNNIMLDKEDE